MSLVDRLRRLGRALPFSPAVMHRLRSGAGVGFRAAAYLKHGRTRRREAPRPGPVCVVGFHGSVLGIGEAARSLSAALRSAGAEVYDWDISARFGHDVRLGGPWRTDPPDQAASMIIFLNPRELIQLVAMTGSAPFAGRRCIGAWAWELERVPASWRAGFRYVDEVWACSRFVADAVRPAAPPGFPVRVLPHPVLPSAAAPDRARFGLPGDKVVVLTVFDVRSGFVRKNPLAAVRAFRRAGVSDRALLLCKAAGVEGAPDLMADLEADIGAAGDVRLMTEWLTGAEMSALMASVDIILSLHRSEGFGLLPAQGMAAGKAVVATGWSANLDFMTPDNGALVDYTLVPVNDPQALYSGGRWAEPDLDDAARKLALLVADPAARQALGARAAAKAATDLAPGRIGRQALDWLSGGA
jgi:glycosyltransferase involved in cell wall biosynthesis